jgi:hypothetical protein
MVAELRYCFVYVMVIDWLKFVVVTLAVKLSAVIVTFKVWALQVINICQYSYVCVQYINK